MQQRHLMSEEAEGYLFNYSGVTLSHLHSIVLLLVYGVRICTLFIMYILADFLYYIFHPIC